MIRVQLPYHLRNLAGVAGEVELAVAPPVSIAAILDALEARHPVLRGAIRDHVTHKRRPFLRFFACEQDYSLEPAEVELPEAVAAGREPLLIVGAIAGGGLLVRDGEHGAGAAVHAIQGLTQRLGVEGGEAFIEHH